MGRLTPARIYFRILNENHLHLQEKFSRCWQARLYVAPKARFDASRQDVRGKMHAVVLPFRELEQATCEQVDQTPDYKTPGE